MGLSGIVQDIARDYESLLSSHSYNGRLAHHLAHGASELSLVQELAFMVNSSSTYGGAIAVLEDKRVDLKLRIIQDKDINLEFKQLPPHFWCNWHEVARDLRGTELKAAADYAVVILFDWTDALPDSKRAKKQYQKNIDSIPLVPGPFNVTVGKSMKQRELRFELVHSSPEISLAWGKPAPDWPNGYHTKLRILWIKSVTDQS